MGRLLLLFVVVVIGCILFGSMLNMIVFWISDLDPFTLQTSALSTSQLRISLLIMTLFSFLIPALIFTRLHYRNRYLFFLGLRSLPRGTWLAASAVMLLLMLPIIQYSYQINQSLPLPKWMTEMESSASDTLEVLLQMNNPQDLVISILLIAILPALGEELVFRGILQKYGYRFFRSNQVSVWITAIIFSAIHLQFAGFFPRFLLGLFLGYLYLWTRNLWVPIFVHFLNNAIMLVVAFAMGPEQISVEESALPELPIWGALGACVLLVPFVRYFIQEKNNLNAPQIS